MDSKELQIIMDLMDELKDKMEYGEDDFNDRLGRKKPDLEMMKIEGKLGEEPKLEHDEDLSGSDLDHDDEQSEDPEHQGMMMGDEEKMSPDDELKKRLMSLRK